MITTNPILMSLLYSWERGTLTQAILEFEAAEFSVFSASPLPPSSDASHCGNCLAPVLSVAKSVVSGRSVSNGANVMGPQPLIKDDSAADPASLGVAVLLANWTGQSGQNYRGAAKDQLDYLLHKIPRTNDGAISHRVAEVQLWCVKKKPPRPLSPRTIYSIISQERFCIYGAAFPCVLWRIVTRLLPREGGLPANQVIQELPPRSQCQKSVETRPARLVE
jgi:hypothetical protein